MTERDLLEMPQLPPILSPELAAAVLRCEPRTVQEECRRGNLPGLKIGVDWIIPSAALIARVNSLAVEEAEKRLKGRGDAANDSAKPTLVKFPGGERKPPPLS